MTARAQRDEAALAVGRRGLFSLVAGAAAVSVADPAAAAGGKEVGNYLPAAGIDDFVRYTPGKQATPAIRAGTVSPDSPYTFAIPPTWSEERVANIASGNYCQPRCVEPWTEVIFSNPREGRCEIIVAPLERLTPRKNPKIEEIGDTQGVLNSIGQFLTGNFLEQEDVVSQDKTTFDDSDLVYYTYELNAPDALTGPHILAQITAKGELALMIKVTADEKQWKASQDKLRKLTRSFRASVPRA